MQAKKNSFSDQTLMHWNYVRLVWFDYFVNFQIAFFNNSFIALGFRQLYAWNDIPINVDVSRCLYGVD